VEAKGFNMDNEVDQYEHYNYEADKIANQGHSGKQRSKKEVAEHSNHPDPSGHTRKIQTKLENTEKNRKNSGSKS